MITDTIIWYFRKYLKLKKLLCLYCALVKILLKFPDFHHSYQQCYVFKLSFVICEYCSILGTTIPSILIDMYYKTWLNLWKYVIPSLLTVNLWRTCLGKTDFANNSNIYFNFLRAKVFAMVLQSKTRQLDKSWTNIHGFKNKVKIIVLTHLST